MKKQLNSLLWVLIITSGIIGFIAIINYLNSQTDAERTMNKVREDSLDVYSDSLANDYKDNKILSSQSSDDFLKEVKENQNIYNAAITDANFLAISVMNDGMDKTPMARSYCIRAAQRGIKLSGVKILDASDAKFETGAAYGTELAKSFCN